MGLFLFIPKEYQRLLSIPIMKALICLIAAVVVASASFQPLLAPPQAPHYRRPGYPGHSLFGGGAMDPMTYLLLQKNGGLLGGSGSSSNSLLPFLLGGGGLGGLGGGHGKFNPLLFSLLGGCK